MTTTIRDWPFITTDVRGDGTVEVVIAGTKKLTTDLDSAIELIHHDAAVRMQRPVRVRLSTSGQSSGTIVVTPEATYYFEEDGAEEIPIGADPVNSTAGAAATTQAGPAVTPPPTPTLPAAPKPDYLSSSSSSVREPILPNPEPAPVPSTPSTTSNPSTSSAESLSEQTTVLRPTSHRAGPPVDAPTRPAAAASPAPEPAPAAPAAPPAAAPESPTETTSSALQAIRERAERPTTSDDLPGNVYRRSFIHEDPKPEVAELGWRARMNKLGFNLAPGRKERELLADIDIIASPFAGPRTIAVGNPKGSANKTPTTAMLAAAFARFGRSGVLAWDNNETRGSLAWRTQKANHDATVIEALKSVEDLLSPDARAAEMGRFTHHQPEDKYDVLQSDQSVDGDHEVSGEDVAQLHQVAAHYFRLIVMDSGNNERAANWRAMIQRADILVVPLTNSQDTAEAGARMLEALSRRDEHSKALAQKAVAIISQRTPGRDPKTAQIARDFAPLVRDIAMIPYDPEMNASTLVFDKLEEATQRAWISAAAMVAEGL